MEEKALPVPHSVGGRVLYAVATMVLPAICFLLADLLKPEWQSGQLSAYASLLLGPWVTLFFASFLAYAVVCLALLLIAPERFARFFVVRLGIYSGFLLALQYAVPIVGGLFLCGAPWPLWWGFQTTQRRFGAKRARNIALGLVVACVVLIGAASIFTYGAPLTLVLVVLSAGAPFWCLNIAAVVSFRLLRDYELKGRLTAWHVVGPLAWLGAFGTAWRFAVLRMWEVYATLPPQPPDCYVATAAAQGHPRFVGSWPAAVAT
jgi:hypothetical protein